MPAYTQAFRTGGSNNTLRGAFLTGAGLIAVRTKVAILPATITGTEQLSRKRRQGQQSDDQSRSRSRRPRVAVAHPGDDAGQLIIV